METSFFYHLGLGLDFLNYDHEWTNQNFPRVPPLEQSPVLVLSPPWVPACPPSPSGLSRIISFEQ